MNSRYEKSYGDNYEDTKDMDMVELARLIKSDIKEMMEEDEIPEMKLSVTSNRSPREINVKFKSFPEDKKLLVTAEESDWGYEHLSEEAQEVIDKVEEFVESFNYDGSDIQTDYFNVRFYKSVKFDWKLKSARRDSQ